MIDNGSTGMKSPGSVPSMNGKLNRLISRMTGEFSRTPFFGRVIRSAVWDFIRFWRKRADLRESDIWLDPAAVRDMAEVLPLLVNEAVSIMIKTGSTLRGMPPKERAACIRSMVQGIDTGRLAELLTLHTRNLAEIQSHDPRFLAELLREPFHEFICNYDFGELKEMVDAGSEGAVAAVTMMSETMWRYPAKTICLLALLPSLMNTAVRALNEIAVPVNNNAPDLLADVLLSMLREVDGKEIGRLANSLAELVRKIHTGSALLGEPGIPQFSLDMRNKLKDAMEAVDPLLLFKARRALAEDAETVRNSLTELLDGHPDIIASMIKNYSAGKNPGIRAGRRRMNLFENLQGEELSDAFSEGAADLETQEMAETVNSLLRTMNRIHQNKPGLLPQVLSEMAVSLDAGELKTAAEWIVPDVVRSMKPASGAVMPSLVRGLCGLLTPEPGEDAGELEKALDSLRVILAKKEVPR